MTIEAVYEGGVLRPRQPLALAEGETVDVTIAHRKPAGVCRRPLTPAEGEYRRRIMAAKTLEEMYAIMATAAPLPDDYDLSKALNVNRKATGERLLFPENRDGSAP